MKVKIFLIIFALFISSSTANARDYNALGPITTRNQNPVYLQTLSLTPMRAYVLPEGTIEGRVDSAYSSVFLKNSNTTADLNLDMEIWRISPWVTYGIAEGMELGIEIPFLHFGGGVFDSFIQKFHNAFHFPNGGREQVADNQFSYLLGAGGSTQFNFPSADFGLGDISLHFKNQLTGEDKKWPAIAWFVDLKFPTGQKSRGFGNGSVDMGFGLAIETEYRRLHGFVNAGYYATGGNNLFVNYMHNEMLAYMVAGELSLLRSLSLIVQLDGSTPLLTKTRLEQWDGVPLDLVIGFRGELQKLIASEDFIWQFGFSEDVTSRGPSVDFTLFVSLGIRMDIFGKSRPAGDWLARKN